VRSSKHHGEVYSI